MPYLQIVTNVLLKIKKPTFYNCFVIQKITVQLIAGYLIINSIFTYIYKVL